MLMKCAEHCRPRKPYQRRTPVPSVCTLFILFESLISQLCLIVNTEHKVCNVYIVSDTVFSDLVKNGSSFFDDITNGQNIVRVTLTFDSNAERKFGAFKQAIVGRSNIQVLGDSTSVMIKQ